MSYPPALQEIIEFFEHLSESSRRDALIAYADMADRYAPEEDAEYQVIDSRKDPECVDTVSIFLNIDRQRRVNFRFRLGSQVQTLTRAMMVILCKGLNGAKPDTIVNLYDDFVPRIVGSELMRLRSRTVYYVLRRLREAAAKAQ